MTVAKLVRDFRGDRTLVEAAEQITRGGCPISHEAIRLWENGSIPNKKTRLLLQASSDPEVSRLGHQIEGFLFTNKVPPPV